MTHRITIEISEKAYRMLKTSYAVACMADAGETLLAIPGARIVEAIENGETSITLKTRKEREEE